MDGSDTDQLWSLNLLWKAGNFFDCIIKWIFVFQEKRENESDFCISTFGLGGADFSRETGRKLEISGEIHRQKPDF